MTATESTVRLRSLAAALFATLLAIALIGVAPAANAQTEDLEDGLEDAQDELDDGGGGEDPGQELEDALEDGDGNELEDALDDASGGDGGDGGDTGDGAQEDCETAFEAFFDNPDEGGFENAVQTCADSISEDLDVDDGAVEDCEAAFEAFFEDPNEETFQAAVDECVATLEGLLEDDGEPDPEPDDSEPDPEPEVDEVPQTVETGGTGTPTDGAQAGGALALFVGLTAAGTVVGSRRLGGLL